MRFYPAITRSVSEVQGEISLLVHSLNGCTLDCYNCHNKKEFPNVEQKEWDDKTVLNQLKRMGFADNIILSGGEFLDNPIRDIIRFIQKIDDLGHSFRIIVNTNGMNPRKMEQLLPYVDGFHLDVKLPYWKLDPIEDADVYKEILGRKISVVEHGQLLKSLQLLIEFSSDLDECRTVRYPQLPDEVFEEIAEYMYETGFHWRLNNFMY